MWILRGAQRGEEEEAHAERRSAAVAALVCSGRPGGPRARRFDGVMTYGQVRFAVLF